MKDRDLNAAFDRLMGGPFVPMVDRYERLSPTVVTYLFDGFMPCCLVAEGDGVIDVQDVDPDDVLAGMDLTNRRRFPSVMAWADQFMIDMTQEQGI